LGCTLSLRLAPQADDTEARRKDMVDWATTIAATSAVGFIDKIADVFKYHGKEHSKDYRLLQKI
jgi:hypothetical protein